MLIDTHCHIINLIKEDTNAPLSENDFLLGKLIEQEANLAQIFKIIEIGYSAQESINCVKLAEKLQSVYAGIAVHPNDIGDNFSEDLKILKKLLQNDSKKIVAIGETGLDYYYPNFNKQKQIDAFSAQIELAIEHKLPLSIHTRSAAEDTLNTLLKFKDKNLKGVIHCFSEDIIFAEECIALNFKLGIGGTISYPKNDYLRNVVKIVGLENIVLETDAPYLPIQKMRGKINHPKHIYDIALYIAELLNIDFETVCQATTNNALSIFTKLNG